MSSLTALRNALMLIIIQYRPRGLPAISDEAAKIKLNELSSKPNKEINETLIGIILEATKSKDTRRNYLRYTLHTLSLLQAYMALPAPISDEATTKIENEVTKFLTNSNKLLNEWDSKVIEIEYTPTPELLGQWNNTFPPVADDKKEAPNHSNCYGFLTAASPKYVVGGAYTIAGAIVHTHLMMPFEIAKDSDIAGKVATLFTAHSGKINSDFYKAQTEKLQQALADKQTPPQQAARSGSLIDKEPGPSSSGTVKITKALANAAATSAHAATDDTNTQHGVAASSGSLDSLLNTAMQIPGVTAVTNTLQRMGFLPAPRTTEVQAQNAQAQSSWFPGPWDLYN